MVPKTKTNVDILMTGMRFIVSSLRYIRLFMSARKLPNRRSGNAYGRKPDVRDLVIGMSDGLTVPFALAAGLSGAVASTGIIVTAGFAEIAAGSIAMGLGGYLAARGDAEHYDSERQREELEVIEKPEVEVKEVREVFESYGLTPEESAKVAASLSQRPEAWVDFMMRFELGLERPERKRALTSAATIAGSYIAGGIIPLFPYVAFPTAKTALMMSILVTVCALLVFGYIKGRFTGASARRSALQTALVGGLAAAAAFALAKAIS
jgi:VIT1/CCC1 family predicted Fe2+/Mn2+ transporter